MLYLRVGIELCNYNSQFKNIIMKNVYLHLVSRDEFMRVDVSKIVYVEADGNYTNIILANQPKARCV